MINLNSVGCCVDPAAGDTIASGHYELFKHSERTCPHGVGHPDPDDVLNEDKVHGCDGCCHPENSRDN